MSDEGDDANDAASDGGDTEKRRGSGGRTAVVAKPATRPQRPSGKRVRQRVVDGDAESSAEAEVPKKDSDKNAASEAGKNQAAPASKKAKKVESARGRRANPIAFVYNYLKQVVAELRKVIWPSRKQMITYTSVVLAFLAFMVALVGLADVGLTKLVLLVFG